MSHLHYMLHGIVITVSRYKTGIRKSFLFYSSPSSPLPLRNGADRSQNDIQTSSHRDREPPHHVCLSCSRRGREKHKTARRAYSCSVPTSRVHPVRLGLIAAWTCSGHERTSCRYRTDAGSPPVAFFLRTHAHPISPHKKQCQARI